MALFPESPGGGHGASQMQFPFSCKAMSIRRARGVRRRWIDRKWERDCACRGGGCCLESIEQIAFIFSRKDAHVDIAYIAKDRMETVLRSDVEGLARRVGGDRG